MRVNYKSAQELQLPVGLACEVQVRTLLQHAYAELAHSRTYKPHGEVDRETLRQVAKSAALVETADEIFVDVNAKLEKATFDVRRTYEAACNVFSRRVGIKTSFDAKVGIAILDPYRPFLPAITEAALEGFISDHCFVIARITERESLSALFRNPCVLVVYFLVWNDPDAVPKGWPFDQKYLEMFYTDLGISADGRL